MGRSSLTHLAILLTLCLAHSLATTSTLTTEPGYRSCEMLGLTHFRSFETTTGVSTPVETCLQSGSRVLVHNQWLKVVLHSYLNETTFKSGIEWHSTKIFIEFYGDLAHVPIALVSSDILLCDCTLNCAIDRQIRETGVDGAIRILLKHDAILGNALYVEYPRAGISLYIRKLRNGFNFGIRMPEQWSLSTDGMCQTGCPIKTDPLACVDSVRGREVCDATLASLPVESERRLSCVHDVYLWRDARIAVNHLLSLFDLSFIRDYARIETLYRTSFEKIDLSALTRFENTFVDIDDSRCSEKLFHHTETISASRDQTVVQSYAQPLVVPVVKSEVPVSYGSEPLPVLEPTTRKIVVELPESGYGTVQREETVTKHSQSSYGTVLHEETVVEGTERADLARFCVEHRSKSGMYYLMLPQLKSMFVQCDESNRAFLRSCPIGTVFTERMTCEKAQESISMDFVPEATHGYGSVQVQKDVTVVPEIPVVPTHEAVESVEFRKECETRRVSHKGVFFFPTPDSRTTYIQCDESNRAFIRTCPAGTVFTENLACERIGEEIKIAKPVVQLDSVQSYGVQREEVQAIKTVEIIPIEAPEYNALCLSQRLTKVGLFYLSFPSNRSMFIQCDESNRAFVKTCPVETVFTDALTCEKITEVRPVVPSVPLPIVQTVQTSYGNVEIPRPVVTEVPRPVVTEVPRPVVVEIPKPIPIETPKVHFDTEVSSSEAVESIEFRKDCESRRLSSKGLFFIAHPTSKTMYIQCDESSRAFVRTCATGTVFTENLACEKVDQVIHSGVQKDVVEIVKPVVRPVVESIVEPIIAETTTVEAVEFRRECEAKRLTHKGVFFIAHPTSSRSQYIQCDEANRAFVRTCPAGTVFTENLACERIGEQVKSVVVEQVKPIVTVVQDMKRPVVELTPTHSDVQKDVVITEKVVEMPHAEVTFVRPVVEPIVRPVVESIVAPVVAETSSVETFEFRRDCEAKRTNVKGVFFIPLPANRSHYIQCDEANRAFIRTCPLGTVFTENFACERLGLEIKAEETVFRPLVAEHTVVRPVVAEHTVVKPVVAEHTVVKPVVAEHTVVRPVVAEHTVVKPVVVEPVVAPVASNSYLNSIVSGIKKIFPGISRDETPKKQADILVEDRPLLLQRVPTDIKVNGRIVAEDETRVPNPCSDEMRQQKRFFFIHPTNANKYIQCDEANRMTIKTCFKNTVFSEEKQTCI